MKFLRGFLIYMAVVTAFAAGIALFGGIYEYEIINNIFYLSGILMAICGFRWIHEQGGYSAITYGFAKLFRNSKKSYAESVELENTEEKHVKDMKYHEYYNREIEHWEYVKEVFIYSAIVFIGSIAMSLLLIG